MGNVVEPFDEAFWNRTETFASLIMDFWARQEEVCKEVEAGIQYGLV